MARQAPGDAARSASQAIEDGVESLVVIRRSAVVQAKMLLPPQDGERGVQRVELSNLDVLRVRIIVSHITEVDVGPQ